MADLHKKSPLEQKMADGVCYIDFRNVFQYSSFTKKIGGHMLTRKNGTSQIRLDKPIRSGTRGGLTGVICSWSDKRARQSDRPLGAV